MNLVKLLANNWQPIAIIALVGTTQAATVMDKVNEKLAGGKSDLEYTREHLMLGALQGKILDADGSVILDINTDFKVQRKTQDIELSKDTTKVGAVLDKLLSEQRQKINGAQVRGWVVYCGMEFLSALKEHKSIFEVYKRFDEARAYREGDTLNPTEFVHKGIRFIEYGTPLPVWILRSVQPSPDKQNGRDGFTACLRGNTVAE